MDKDVITPLTIKALRAGEKTAPGEETEYIWLMMLQPGEKGEVPYLIVAKALRPEVRTAFKAHRNKGRWARGTLLRSKNADEVFDFLMEDSKRLRPKEATRLLRLEVAADDLRMLKTTLKSSRMIDPRDLEETEGEESEGEELAREQSRCEEAREKAKNAFLAAKSLISGDELAELIALRDQATQARQKGEFEEATELYLDLIDHCKAAAASSKVDLAQFQKRWLEAIEEVDNQIAALGRALRADGEEELDQIAQFGLPALTGHHRVPFEAALRESQAAKGAQRLPALEKLAEQAKKFHEHIMNAEIVEVSDDNPFDVKVAIRATLGPPLAELAAL
jgi:hypothetical protein